MSLDNVLAVAGIAWEHPWIMIFGLVFSIVLMAVGTPIIVKILERYPKVAYGGLAVILYIGITMIWNGLTILLANTPL
jgi:predicted tellurium resistance membrane protein TerC